MNAREYLSQVRQIDQRINTKLELITKLRSMATKATSTISDTPKDSVPNPHSMENIVVKIVDLEDELNKEIDRLVDLKREILDVIRLVRTPAYQSLLEMRYLGYMTWEMIAEIFGYDTRSAYRNHKGALRAVDSILRQRETE